jgi:FMN phosphatase YigB (HAD superfamily)
MKIILFDLGNTLEDVEQSELLPGARETLEAIQEMRDADGNAPILALVSDFGDIPATPQQIQDSEIEYFEILRGIGILRFFEPLAQRVTLSTQAVAEKPSRRIFQAVIDKLGGGHSFPDIMFITEKKSHVNAAREMGMKAIHFKGPGEISGDVTLLLDLIPLVRDFSEAVQSGDNSFQSGSNTPA